MALLYGLLWRFMLVLVHVNRALVSWLRGRVRSWKGRLWGRAMDALLLPVALAGFLHHQKKLNHNPDANAKPVYGNRSASRRLRWLSDGRSLEKLPIHIGLLVAEEEPSYTDIANLVVWCMAVGISYVSVYDYHGMFQKNSTRLLKEIIRQQQDMMGVEEPKYSVEFLSNGNDKPQHNVVSCRPTLKLLSPEDGKHSIVKAAQKLCRSVEKKEKSSKDISVSMLDTLLREASPSSGSAQTSPREKFGRTQLSAIFGPWLLHREDEPRGDKLSTEAALVLTVTTGVCSHYHQHKTRRTSGYFHLQWNYEEVGSNELLCTGQYTTLPKARSVGGFGKIYDPEDTCPTTFCAD
uniref:ditrans,polycis-polyprenyl diphosphate synthase [(2E,6E)-farnesyldiphosphate specific] n=1 Tax=Mastacembelus armatus TaxID=205130 RepID=A0A3Q3KJL6_9TELE